MKKLINLLIKNKVFIIPYLFVAFISLYFLLVYEKAEIHIYLNGFHNSFFDFFFKYWTHIGSGFFAIFTTLLLLFYKYKWALISAVSNLLTAIIVQVLKRIVFSENVRPKFFFKYFNSHNYQLYLVEGTNPGSFYSFPSGNSASAFAIFFLFSLISKNKYLKFIFFIIALSATYSRVYLSWHFLGDITFGSAIGLLITLIVYCFLNKSTSEWMDFSILTSFKRKN